MHKETNWDKITPKAENNYSQEPKREKIVWGMGENAAAWDYIASVGSPSGRCINVVRTRATLGTSRQVAHVWTVLLIVRPMVAASIRT
jgi:hypothetical protein